MFEFAISVLLLLIILYAAGMLGDFIAWGRKVGRWREMWQNKSFVYNKTRDGVPACSARSLGTYYGVNPDTIEKWITYFTDRPLLFGYYLSEKKMNETFETKLTSILGKPTEANVSKADLVAKLGEQNGLNYKTNCKKLKEIIIHKFPSMENFYSKIDFFPPAVATKILTVI